MLFSGSDRRSVFAIAMVALTVAAGLAGSHAHAAPAQIERLEIPASALKPAVRLSQTKVKVVSPTSTTVPLPTGTMTFPMNPLPRCAISKSSFGQPRGADRRHEGLDIMATLGQEVYAADGGVIWKQSIDGTPGATLSGNSWTIRLPDGTYYFYGHLSKFADGLVLGASVVRGQLIGYVGDTGNPGPGNYHLHFEVHPNGAAAVDPFPLLAIPKSCSFWT